jgi:hypothetical protein
MPAAVGQGSALFIEGEGGGGALELHINQEAEGLHSPSFALQDSQPGSGGEARPFYDFLESCLRHKAEMVIFEAARAICNLKDVTTRE